MKKMLTENLWLKLFSIVIAFLLWILILYTYDPAATADFNLNVDVVNGETISKLGKVYEVIEGKNITIRVKANSSLVKTLKSTDFKATADVSKLSPTFHANIDVLCTKSNNIDIRLIGKAKFLEVKLENLVSEQFPVSVEKRGEAKEGFFVGSAVPKPNFINVSGGESSIKRIKTVKVRVDAKGANESFTTYSEPKAFDADGNEITTGELKFSENKINVFLDVFQTKAVPIVIKPKGHPYLGYAVDGIDYDPKKVTVASSKEKLDSLFQLTVPINVSSEITDVEASLRLSDYLPEGFYLVEPDTMVNVKCKIVRMVSKKLLLSEEEITLANEREAFDYEFVEEVSIPIDIKGLQREIDKLTIQKLNPRIDVGEITEVGEYSLEMKMDEIKDIMISSLGNVKIRVKEKSGPEDEETQPAGDNKTPLSEVENEKEEGDTEEENR